MHPGRIRILDTTLREGEQAPGVYFTPAQKARIASALDEVGVDIIEVGNPMADPKIAEAVRHIAAMKLRATVGAHARCRIDDANAALECRAGLIGIFLSVAEKRLQVDYGLTFVQAVDMVQKVVSHIKTQDPAVLVRYTPEDTVRSNFEHVVEASVAAVQAGADIISVADTTGRMTPARADHLGTYVAELKAALAARGCTPLIAVHCHNDRGLALANALQACASGADIVDASVLGLGERTGIVDLAQLALNLAEMDRDRAPWRLDRLAEVYALVSKSSGRFVPHNFPIVGKFAFTHYSGVHVRAVREDPSMYMSLDPALFGLEWGLALGTQSGRHSIELALEMIGRSDLAHEQELVKDVLTEVKEAGCRGEPLEVFKDFLAIAWAAEREWKARSAHQRMGERRVVNWPGLVEIDGVQIPVRIRDVSRGGASIECEQALPPGGGSLLFVAVPETPKLTFEIRYTRDGRLGLQFLEGVPQTVLVAAGLLPSERAQRDSGRFDRRTLVKRQPRDSEVPAPAVATGREHEHLDEGLSVRSRVPRTG
ncbi:MAG TPA: LeuA family protein [Kofleriaceae bacterium]|nr:LeuA family protein [Kofleriaceae bacterium]